MNKKNPVVRGFVFLLLSLTVSAAAVYPDTEKKIIPGKQPKASAGIIDLSNRDFEKDAPVELNGQWRFFWNVFTDPTEDFSEGGDLIEQPGIWNNFQYPGRGYGSFTLKILLPDSAVGRVAGLRITYLYTAYSLYINGKQEAGNGITGSSRKTSSPQYLPQVILFTPDSTELSVVLHVSNFHHRKGGMPEPLLFGAGDKVLKIREGRMMIEMITIGILAIIGLYHLMIFLFRHKEKSALFFSLYCFAIAFRTLLLGERIWYQLFPDFPWFIGQKLDYLTVYLSFPLIVYFLHLLYPDDIKKILPRITAAASAVFALIVISTPANIFTRSITWYFIIIVAACTFLVTFLFLAAKKGKAGAKLLLGGSLVFFITGLNDILYNNGLISTAYLSSSGLVFFTITQTILLSYLFTRAYNLIEIINESLWRFVPREFLQFLGKKDIVEIQLGDQVHGKLTVLFSDIRGFTSLSEQMTPEENFHFINSFLEYTGPVIRKFGGFIDKYIGDAIMAIFPGDAVQAVKAAVEMQHAAREFNEANRNLPPVSIGIAINTGTIMLGIVGEKERIESTVISDVVNVASRLENLNKELGTEIIISESVYLETGSAAFPIRWLGSRKVRGRAEAVSIYEVMPDTNDDKASGKLKDKDLFEKALKKLEAGMTEEAFEILTKLKTSGSGDKAVEYYLTQLKNR